MPAPSRRTKVHDRRGLGVEVTAAVARFAAPDLDEALAVAVEALSARPAGDGGGDVPGHDFGLGVGEHARFRQRLAELQRDRDDVADRVDAGEARLEGVPVGGDPAVVAGEPALTDDARRAMRRNVREEIEVRAHAVREVETLRLRAHCPDRMLGVIGDALRLEHLLHGCRDLGPGHAHRPRLRGVDLDRHRVATPALSQEVVHQERRLVRSRGTLVPGGGGENHDAPLPQGRKGVAEPLRTGQRVEVVPCLLHAGDRLGRELGPERHHDVVGFDHLAGDRHPVRRSVDLFDLAPAHLDALALEAAERALDGVGFT